MAITLRIIPDPDPLNPCIYHDNIGKMVCWHNKYNLGDKHDFKDSEEFFRSLISSDTETELEKQWDAEVTEFEADQGVKYGSFAYAEAMDRFYKAHIARLHEAAELNHIILPLYLYEHSGLTISTASFSCPWDSGQIGYIYCTVEQARQRDQAVEYLTGEVETYDQYLRGDVYGFVITDTDTGENLDSCWGFYGEDDALNEGTIALKHYQSKETSNG